ncbi:MAG: DUF1264 domain-containing protein, partial [Opitutae bacterium]|nr:DUF1264 domain-containing protein [Opitutae bacterium]
RDRAEHTDTAKTRAARADLATRPIAPGADSWQTGPAFQLGDDRAKTSPHPGPEK